MGTDIHGVFQRKAADGSYADISSLYEQSRHYQLFAVLAGVRNGSGFAGVKTGEEVAPISEPRGFPEDFCVNDDDVHPLESLDHMDPRRRKWHEDGDAAEVWMGDHSHSWLSGQEILSWFGSAPVVQQCGIISRAEFATWDHKTCPSSYCGGISGPNVILVDFNTFVDSPKKEWTHIRVYWNQSLRDELQYFFDEVRRLVDEHGDIRFVFGFDS